MYACACAPACVCVCYITMTAIQIWLAMSGFSTFTVSVRVCVGTYVCIWVGAWTDTNSNIETESGTHIPPIEHARALNAWEYMKDETGMFC